MDFVDLSKLKGEVCYGGIDLASTRDLTAVSVMFPPNPDREYHPDKYIFKSMCYLPEESVINSPNNDFYKKAIKAGHLTQTPGNVTDYDYIIKDLCDINANVCLENAAYDPYNASQMIIDANNAGIPTESFAQGTGNFNRCTKEFERLIFSGKVIIDGNVVTRWCFANVVLKEDTNQNIKPIKNHKNQKIDIVISMLQSLGIYLLDPHYCYAV